MGLKKAASEGGIEEMKSKAHELQVIENKFEVDDRFVSCKERKRR
jgi:hypothetical protein